METLSEKFKDHLHSMDFYDPSISDGIRSLRFVSEKENSNLSPTEIFTLEKAEIFKADAVYFRHFSDGRAPIPQIYLYDNSDDKWQNADLANIHRDLWSSCLIPIFIVINKTTISIFDSRKPVQISGNSISTKALETLELTDKALKAYSAKMFDNGLFWESEKARGQFSIDKSAYRDLIDGLKGFLKTTNISKEIAHKLLVFSILIKYIEDRGEGNDRLFAEDFFKEFDANNLCGVLRKQGKIVRLFEKLRKHFNGKIFEWKDSDEEALVGNADLNELADFLDADKDGIQMRFWRKYSFKYLPVELISSVYETLLGDSNDVVYTPNFLVNTLLDDSYCMPLSNFKQLDFKVIDVSCGSGIFLVSAFKRLVQRWRYNEFIETGELVHPTANVMLSLIKANIFGVDIKEGAVRLTVFSLCLALCDELTPKEIWTELRFDDTFQTNFKHQNFFAFLNDAPKSHWDLVVGNPPFIELKTQSLEYKEILKLNKDVAEKVKKKIYPQVQIALMFLDQASNLVKEKGIVCLIMPSAPLLYNNSTAFRDDFFPRHQVLQILDFTNLNATLFGKADVPTAAIYVQKTACNETQPITHLTVRRTKATNEKLFFEVDNYDFHHVSQIDALKDKHVWKCNLLGGGRLRHLIDRLSDLRTIEEYVDEKKWVYGEGYIETKQDISSTDYVSNKAFLDAEDFTESGIVKIKTSGIVRLHRKTNEGIFKSPHFLIKQNIGKNKIPTYFSNDYLTFKNTIVAINAPQCDYNDLKLLHDNFNNQLINRLFVAATSNKYLVVRATHILTQDIMSLPYPEDKEELELSFAENIICEDVLNYYIELLSKGDRATVNNKAEPENLNDFGEVFSTALNSIYEEDNKRFYLNDIQDLGQLYLCTFNYGENAEGGQVPILINDKDDDYLKSLVNTPLNQNINLMRVIKLYEKNKIYLLKPKSLRYWLKSIALRDADEVFSDLIKAGY
jgi:methylase of polypeptide subunit release factors